MYETDQTIPATRPRGRTETLATALIAFAWILPGHAQELVSIAGDGSQGNSVSREASVSDDGRFVAFQSSASNFAAGDELPVGPPGISNTDVFVFDTQTGELEFLSAGLDGLPTNLSRNPEISGDGRYVVFDSFADNLVPDDLNEFTDVFFFDRQTQVLQRINLGLGGSDADGFSDGAAISGDGAVVVFESTAPNLVSDDTNDVRDIFVWLRDSGTIERVNLAFDGSEADIFSDQPAVSRDGRFVSFESASANLVPGDSNSRRDIFVVDRTLGSIERISVRADGTEANDSSEESSISADGRFVAFESRATNLVDDVLNGPNNIYVKDRLTGELTLVSKSTSGISADAFCEWPSISPDGRFVAFDCPGTSLAPVETGGVESVYLHDRADATTTLVSKGFQGLSGNDGSNRPSIGVDVVAFASSATNLVPDDTNDYEDVFVVRVGIFKDDFEAPSQP